MICKRDRVWACRQLNSWRAWDDDVESLDFELESLLSLSELDEEAFLFFLLFPASFLACFTFFPFFLDLERPLLGSSRSAASKRLVVTWSTVSSVPSRSQIKYWRVSWAITRKNERIGLATGWLILIRLMLGLMWSLAGLWQCTMQYIYRSISLTGNMERFPLNNIFWWGCAFISH